MNPIDYITEMLESIESGMSKGDTMSIPDPAILTFYSNLSERRIWIDLCVDDNVLEYARWIMRWNAEDKGKPTEERKPIWLYLFNYGGGADYMWMLTDIISLSETPVYTVNVGQCCSAAALIFMAGHKRYMFPTATLLIHEGSGQIEGDAVKVMDQAASYKAMVKKMHDYILAHTQIPSSTLSRKKNNDWELNSAECLKYGICDEIVDKMSVLF